MSSGLKMWLSCVDVQGFAGECFDEGAEGDEVDVGVLEGLAGGAVGDGGDGAADAFGFVGGGEAPVVFEVDVFGEAGVVGEELADGDLGFPGEGSGRGGRLEGMPQGLKRRILSLSQRDPRLKPRGTDEAKIGEMRWLGRWRRRGGSGLRGCRDRACAARRAGGWRWW